MREQLQSKPLRFRATALGNGSRLFLKPVDLRSVTARRYRELLGDILAELGPPPYTSWQGRTAETLAQVTLHLETLRADMAQGKFVPTTSLLKLVSWQHRLMKSLAVGDEDRITDGEET